MNNLQEKYNMIVIPALQAEFGYKNRMAVPRMLKTVVNVGVGRLHDEKEKEEVVTYLTLITGQKPVPRQAKQAIAAFKTREGMIIGYQVTLRGSRMYDFISRLINIALPRSRDFQGLDGRSFDEKGNLTIGIKENIIFPEMIGEDYRFLFGLEATMVTTAQTREEGIALLKLMGFPVKKD